VHEIAALRVLDPHRLHVAGVVAVAQESLEQELARGRGVQVHRLFGERELAGRRARRGEPADPQPRKSTLENEDR